MCKEVASVFAYLQNNFRNNTLSTKCNLDFNFEMHPVFKRHANKILLNLNFWEEIFLGKCQICEDNLNY